MIIKEVKLQKILNSRSQWNIEATVITRKGAIGKASAPSGASTGSKEVNQYKRNSIEQSLKVPIKLSGMKFATISDFEKIENKIANNGTINSVGGNLIIAVEYAILDAWSKEHKKPIHSLITKELGKMEHHTLPLSNIIGGGAHSGGNSTDIQEFLICSRAKSFEKSLEINIKVHQLVKQELLKKDKDFSGAKTDEGAWASTLNNYECLKLLKSICKKVEKEEKVKIDIGLDVAATELHYKKRYHYNKYTNIPSYSHLKSKAEKSLTRDQHIEYIIEFAEQFNLFYLEDPVEENDAAGFDMLKRRFPDKLICGDDLICTNLRLLKKYHKSINSIIVKPNQVGSVLKTLQVVKLAKSKGLKIIVSHRSGETTDSVLADLAWGFYADYFKCGATTGERVVKLNRLIEIERESKKK